MKKLIYGFLVVILTNCASVSMTRINHAPYKADTCELDVFTSKQEIEKKYKTLCLLDVKSGSGAIHDRSVTGNIDQARVWGCRCGGDAIVLLQANQSSSDGWGSAQAKSLIEVIKYK